MLSKVEDHVVDIDKIKLTGSKGAPMDSMGDHLSNVRCQPVDIDAVCADGHFPIYSPQPPVHDRRGGKKVTLEEVSYKINIEPEDYPSDDVTIEAPEIFENFGKSSKTSNPEFSSLTRFVFSSPTTSRERAGKPGPQHQHQHHRLQHTTVQPGQAAQQQVRQQHQLDEEEYSVPTTPPMGTVSNVASETSFSRSLSLVKPSNSDLVIAGRTRNSATWLGLAVFSRHSTRSVGTVSAHSGHSDFSSAKQSEATSGHTVRGLHKCLDGQLRDDVTELITFDRCEDLLRGISMAKVLHRFGQIFSSSAASKMSFELSSRVEGINYFLSHNWCVGRWKKTLALALHFYTDSALVLTWILCCGLGALAATGHVPTVYSLVAERPQAVTARILALPFFFFTTLFIQRVASWFGFDGPTVFLDKACINQVDPTLQSQGIRKIGAFLCNSEKLLILYTDEYLQRLWTTYEVAGFLTTHNVTDVEVVHTFQATLFFCMMGYFYLFNLSIPLVRMFSNNYLFIYPLFAFCGLPLIWYIRRSCRERGVVRHRLANFDVRNCLCQEEGDRPIVYRNIIALMKASQAVDMSADDEEALDVFNAKVQRELPIAFGPLLTHSIFRYKHYAILGFFASGLFPFDYFSDFAHEIDTIRIVSSTLYSLQWSLVHWPLVFHFAEKMSHTCPNVTGAREIPLVATMHTCFAVILGIFDVFLRRAVSAIYEEETNSNRSILAIGHLGCVCLLGIFVRWIINKGFPRCPYGPRDVPRDIESA